MNDDSGRIGGHVLLRENAGERHLRLTLLDARLGVVKCLYRPAGKAGAPTVTPDLFDEAEITLDRARAGEASRFVSEYRLVRRHDGLGRDYARLTLACRLSAILAKNPHPPESFERLHGLAGEAFAAFADKPRADAAYFKCLWLLARDEGHPVKEDFFQKLRLGERDIARLLLRTPLATLDETTAPPATVAHISRTLEIWLEHDAHFIIGHG